MPFSTPDLAQAVRRFLDDNLAAHVNPRQVIVNILQGTDEPVQVTILLSRKPLAQNDEQEPAVKGRSSLPDCLTDILLTLREHHPRRLTKTRLLEEMFKKGRTYADSTVARYLAELMEDGTINNPGTKSRTPGYGISDPEDVENT